MNAYLVNGWREEGCVRMDGKMEGMGGGCVSG